MTASGFGHLKATVRRNLVVDSEIRPCQHKERLDALHTEIRMEALRAEPWFR